MTEASRVQTLLNDQNAEIDRLKNRIVRLEVALGGAYSWIDRWAKHVPNCRAPMRPCTCGRDAVMYELSSALEEKHER